MRAYRVLVLALEEAGRDAVKLIRVLGGKPGSHLLVRDLAIVVGVHLLEDIRCGLYLKHLVVDAYDVDLEPKRGVGRDVLACATLAVTKLRRNNQFFLLSETHSFYSVQSTRIAGYKP
jgi:hypothetical protein